MQSYIYKYLETLHPSFTLQKVQFSHPTLWGNNILHKFYRIAAYDKQIRCLAYAHDLTGLSTTRKYILYRQTLFLSTVEAAPQQGLQARWEPVRRACVHAVPGGGGEQLNERCSSLHHPLHRTEDIPLGPAVPDLFSVLF